MSKKKEGELTNFEIMDICKRLNIKLNGIYMKDQLKKLPAKNGCYIINMSDSNEAGTHWIALYIKNKNAICFDSFGIAPPDEIILWLERVKNVSYSKKQLQDIANSACGWYCILFLYICSNSDDEPMKIIKYIQSLFSPNKLNKNASILYNHIDKLLSSINI